eukprot:scaffold25278_cov132-Cylindrotheca_fusiformis.AAC.7
MAPKKRNAAVGKKRPRPSSEAAASTKNQPNTTKSSQSRNQRVSEQAFVQLQYAIPVLLVAMAVGVLWNQAESADPKMISFLSAICRKVTCARFVIPVSRTLKAARPIRAGETLFEIPRNMQFWDTDALRDDFVQKHLLSARHGQTGNPLSSGAFLAAWIALKLNSDQAESEQAMQSYLELLPSEDESRHHPLLWDKEELKESLGGHSLNFAVANAYSDMIESEYSALVQASDGKFSIIVTDDDYRVARINVLSRSFNPGRDALVEEIDGEEMELYERHGLDFSEGCRAMVPILDMLNHHPNPNVGYSYDKRKEAFIIDARNSIASGWELFDSYGKFTDSHLFAKFGFVNGDGSGWTQASMALFHRILDTGMDQEFSYLPSNGEVTDSLKDYQRKQLIRYLQYDDGYTDCIDGPETHPEQFELKKLKLDHLVRIANNRKSWIVYVPPRAPKSNPAESSDIPITETVPEIDPKNIRVNFSKLIETCRIISMIESDYGGKGMDMLRSNLGNATFVLEKDNDSLEYRASYW